ncbi:MAG: DNA internalization-related competence protein ComEC/Rec2 [Candidatus Rokuibacteriota bacterium]
MTAPLVPIAVTFATGIWLGLLVSPPSWLFPAAGVVAILGLAAFHQHRLPAASAVVLVLVGLAGWARGGLPDPVPATTGLRPGPIQIEGIVIGEPEVEGPRIRLPLWLQAASEGTEWHPASGRLLVHLYGPPPPVRPLDRLRVTVHLSVARPFRNPGTPTGRESAGDPHFVAVGRAGSIEEAPGEAAPWWLRVRVWVHDVVQAYLPPVSGALFEGLLIGERRRLPPTLVADFRAAGVFHVLAISGFNVGLVAAAILLLLRLLRLPGRLAAVVALATLAAFATVVGAQPSVLRATVMAGLVLAGQLLARESGAWNSLAAALLVLLAWDPDALPDPGLQLSFAATTGILHLAPAIRRVLETRWPRWLATAVAVSAAAQLAVTPLMLAHWNQLSLVGIVANLVVVPIAAALTTLGFLAVLLATLSDGLAHLVFQSLWMVLLGLRLVVRIFAALPGAVIHAPTPPPLALGAATLALLLAPYAGRRRVGALVLALSALGVLATARSALPDGKLHVLMLDVGQGEAILVRGPDGRALLLDTGGGGPGRSDRGERIVVPVLHRTGVRRLTAVALTHDDPDHAGGLIGLLEGIPIEEVWVPAGTDGADWQGSLTTAGVPQRVLGRGDRVWLGPLLVTVLHPPRGDAAPSRPEPMDDNNRSLVLRIEWGLAAILLTGDAEAPAERQLLASGLAVRAPLLKVGHHGSRFASSAPFLAAVSPRLALVSVGRRNPFGHPTPSALARLTAAGARVYRTDLDGAIEVTSDGAHLWVRRWANPGVTEMFPLTAAP